MSCTNSTLEAFATSRPEQPTLKPWPASSKKAGFSPTRFSAMLNFWKASDFSTKVSASDSLSNDLPAMSRDIVSNEHATCAGALGLVEDEPASGPQISPGLSVCLRVAETHV